MDLELMHFYSTSTYKTFPSSPSTHLVLRDTLPHTALQHPYLLHQLLAITGFHLAHLNPLRRVEFRLAASTHQDRAVVGIREALVGSLTAENSLALFMASAFLMATTYASGLDRETPGEPEEVLTDILEIFHLHRGIRVVQGTAVERFEMSPAIGLFGQTHFKELGGIISPLRDAVQELSLRFKAGGTSEVINNGLEKLIESMVATNGPTVVNTTELRVVFRWPIIVDGAFLSLLAYHDPAALVVFLYYCVVMRQTEEECWFLRGWSTRLADGAEALLGRSGPRWLEMAAWPLKQIRLEVHWRSMPGTPAVAVTPGSTGSDHPKQAGQQHGDKQEVKWTSEATIRG